MPWSAGSPESARRTNESRSPRLCRWGRSTGSPVRGLEEPEAERKVGHASPTPCWKHFFAISADSGPAASGSFGSFPAHDVLFPPHHACPSPFPLSMPWAWVHPHWHGSPCLLHQMNILWTSPVSYVVEMKICPSWERLLSHGWTVLSLPHKGEASLKNIWSPEGEIKFFTSFWINLPTDSESIRWTRAWPQAALRTHCSRTLAPLGWWYCSGGLDIVGTCSLHPSKSPCLQSACSSGPGTWSSLPHSFAGLKHTKEGWKGVGAWVWKPSNSPLSFSCSCDMGQHVVTSTKKEALTLLPVGNPRENHQKPSKTWTERGDCVEDPVFAVTWQTYS